LRHLITSNRGVWLCLGFELTPSGEERRGFVFRHQIPLTGTMEDIRCGVMTGNALSIVAGGIAG
jgi:hypothetical protein